MKACHIIEVSYTSLNLLCSINDWIEIKMSVYFTIPADRYETLRTLLVPPHSMIPDEEKCRDVISYCGLSTDAKGHKVMLDLTRSLDRVQS